MTVFVVMTNMVGIISSGKYGQIRYIAKAVIERPWKSNVITKKAFTVLSGLDLNFIPEAAVSSVISC